MEKKIFFKTMCWLLFAAGTATVVMSSCKKDEPNLDNPSKTATETIVKAKYVEKLPALIYANAVAFPYKIQWEPVEGATSYNIYKSQSGSVSIVSGEKQTSTFIETNETIIYEGNTTCYYWVTAITKNGESKRPDNGGIKVTHHVVKTCYYGVPCFYNCSRTIEQNSK